MWSSCPCVRSTASIRGNVSSGNETPTSTRMLDSPHFNHSKFRPNSPSPPSGTTSIAAVIAVRAAAMRFVIGTEGAILGPGGDANRIAGLHLRPYGADRTRLNSSRSQLGELDEILQGQLLGPRPWPLSERLEGALPIGALARRRESVAQRLAARAKAERGQFQRPIAQGRLEHRGTRRKLDDG